MGILLPVSPYHPEWVLYRLTFINYFAAQFNHKPNTHIDMTGIFFGSTTGCTEDVANRIAATLGIEASHIYNVGTTDATKVLPFDTILLGSSTWGCGDLQDDWYDFLEAISSLDLSGKRVGIFGCGDSDSYGDTFCGAIAQIYDAMQSTGCTLIGAYEPTDYNVTDSDVCRDGRFVGLAIDEADNDDKNQARITAWCKLIQ